ncbi:oligopeptide transport system substrate-binding protein [Kitasatospora sp. MAP12-15]|uniref:peptide ABC transporter substrate-binding protein n=1 Tax=unclassified Kitasatospora TaxID=2633591 RepID=UPI002474D078|nr:ABC transporter substrate-binding protein [Kitasatospora sp. MAP12-44]MDH6112624.1 oligopeptide transport system substrate-binding protein [Kitasatospora sp. MAP12-44]
MPAATRARWAVIAATSVALVATGCSSSSSGSGSSASGGTSGSGVVTAWWGDPQNPLEPANTNEVNGGAVLNMIFTGLVVYDPKTSKASNANAASITSTDQQNWTVKLNPGWKFSDGTPVTATSYVDAWNYGALVTNKQVNASFFGYIDGYNDVAPTTGAPTAQTMSGLKVVDTNTFTVALSQKFSTWPQTLGYSAYYPLPQAFFSNHAAYLNKPIGNGPYLIDSWTRSQSMQLKPNPSYSGSIKPQNGGINLKVYTDTNAAYADLQSGNLDIDNGIPNSALKTIQNDLNGRYLNQPAGIIQTISFPLNQPQWNTANAKLVRQGISMAIDRPTITKVVFTSTRTPATDWTSPVLGESGGYKSGLCGDACVYDPAKAKALIQQGGGIPGGQLTISYNADGPHKEWVDATCNSINNVLGNTSACVGKPVGTFADFRNQITSKQMTGPFRTGWQMDYPLIQDFMQPVYTTDGSSNDSHYSNPQFDSLVSQANAEANPAQSVTDFQTAEKMLITDMPAIPLWYQNGTVGWSSKVSNVMLDPFSVPVYTAITVK